MKRAGLVLIIGLAAGIAAFAGFYLAGTATSRELLRQPQPELAWLKHEFNLSEPEFTRIVELHEAYMPGCAERCRRIEEQTSRLNQLLATIPEVTPEVEAVMALRAKMRAQCEAEMLKHFLEVSRTMPAEQGQRYLEWVKKQTVLSGEAMEQRHHSHQGHDH